MFIPLAKVHLDDSADRNWLTSVTVTQKFRSTVTMTNKIAESDALQRLISPSSEKVDRRRLNLLCLKGRAGDALDCWKATNKDKRVLLTVELHLKEGT